MKVDVANADTSAIEEEISDDSTRILNRQCGRSVLLCFSLYDVVHEDTQNSLMFVDCSSHWSYRKLLDSDHTSMSRHKNADMF